MTYDTPAAAAPKSKRKGCGIGCLAAVAVFVVIGIAAGMSGGKSTPTASSSNPAASAPQTTPAQQLRDEDIAAGHTSSAAAYDSAFADLSAKCTEQGVPLADEMHATLGLLQKADIRDETHLTVMQHVAASIPAGARMKCSDIAGAYVTLREGK